jgi:ferredoxin
MSDSCKVSPRDEELFDRREALLRGAGVAIGGVLGSLLLSGCRAPQVYRDFPQGSPTGYLVDPRYCTRCGDCLRVCRCDAVGGFTFDPDDKKKSPAKNADEADPAQCWIYLDKCCSCGRCYRVCDVDAITPVYGVERKPARDVPEWKKGMNWGYLRSPNAAKDAHCAINPATPDNK